MRFALQFLALVVVVNSSRVSHASQTGKLMANMFPVNQRHAVWPGLHGKVTTGLAISGGGSRALSATMGFFRGMEMLGLMGKIDAISSSSGGTWASAIYMFANMSTEKLLGLPTSPEKLTLGALKRRNGEFSKAMETWAMRPMVSLRVSLPDRKIWEKVIADSILRPFGLGDLNSFMAPSMARVEEIKAANPVLASRTFLVPQQDRPPVFVMGGLVAEPAGWNADKKSYVPLDMSPDYTGSPFWPNAGYGRNLEVQEFQYTKPLTLTERWYNKKPKTRKEKMGGGLVDSFIFGSKAPVNTHSSDGAIQVEVPSEPFSLGTAVAVSSAAMSNPQRNYWPILPQGQSQAEHNHVLADGGLMENQGLLALLQRGVKKAAVLASTAVKLSRDIDFCKERPMSEWDKIHAPCAHAGCALTSLFGFPYSEGDYYYSHNGVFAKTDLAPLLCELQTVRDAGKPAVTSTTLKVQRNEFWGIRGGNTVELLFVYLEQCTDFEERLPQETRAALRGSEDFPGFPQYPTRAHNSDPVYLQVREANLMAALMEYYVSENAELFGNFFP